MGQAINSTSSLGWAHWPDVGMWARDGSRTVRIAYGLPFGGWTPYRVVHLPHDQELLHLDQQICLVDIPARKIGLIKKRYGMPALQEDPRWNPKAALAAGRAPAKEVGAERRRVQRGDPS